MNKCEFVYYYMKYELRRVFMKLFHKTPIAIYDKDHELLTKESGNQYLYDMVLSDKPFVAGRFGSLELHTMINCLAAKNNLWKVSEFTKDTIHINAGFFPRNETDIMKFTDLCLGLCRDIDLLAIWNLELEDYIEKHYMPDTRLSPLTCLEPYYYEEPWSKALEGKKVLVIHPFTKTIEAQYSRRESIFDNKAVLPEFELKTLKAVQTIAGNKSEFNTWFDALEYMYKKAMDIDFDIAIIGCGAYGLPLAVKLKQAGKQAVHMGGATQVLFGIKGKRWENGGRVSKMMNEYWVRPSQDESPASKKKVEDGCYW